ncbi:MAG TPA: DeoR/GlpR transcriptional regulator [Candidatus Pullichristensenella avicola]|nr:DeoR/GlpR transcriptional regulator [Candidatus Pullichristensenella avicola]
MAYSSLKIDVRRGRILEMLRRDGRVYVSQLSSLLEATPATIRNDLAALEKDGCLERVPGGAVRKAQAEQNASAARIERAAEKRAIAACMAAMVRDGDRLFINSGTTALAVAEALRARRALHVVTNSLPVAALLGAEPSFRVLMLGGVINAYGFTCGGDAQEQLGRYRADWTVLAVDSVSAAGGVTTYHPDEAILNRQMIERAARTVIVADHTKIGRAGFARFHPADSSVCLITDAAAAGPELERLAKQGVEIRVAD